MSEIIIHHEHKIGLIGLTAIGVGTMIGSGWLFSSYYASKIAGPGAYIAWILTSIIILILGLSLSEIASRYPKRGLMARLLVISHSKEFAFVCTITTWLGLTAVIATEAEGSIQYLSSLSQTIKPYIFNNQINQLTHLGLFFSVIIVVLFGIINFWGVKLLSHSNVALTTAKIIIPLLTAISIIFTHFDSHNFTAYHQSFLPYGGSSIFLAMIGAGMVYSFNGFQNIASFASEAKNPKRNIPLAMAFSIFITLIVYITLQTSFIGALSPQQLAKGWDNLIFTSPFVQITMMLNLNLMTLILYVDAVASPSGTGLIYTGSTTRMLTGMSEDKQMPQFFNKMSKYNFSRRSLITTIILAIVFILLFRSWSSLVSFLSLFYVISYMSIPICLGKLRHTKIKGHFSLPLAQLIMPLLFIFLSILFLFSGFPNTSYVAFFVLLTFIIYAFVQYHAFNNLDKIIKEASVILLHILLLSFLSAIGPKTFGGFNFLNHITFFVLTIILSCITYYIGVFRHTSEPEKVN